MDETQVSSRLRKFQELMLNRIKANEYKGDWHDKSVLDIQLLLFKNLHELMEMSLEMNWQGVVDAGVDCANLAFFLADKTGLLVK